MLFSRRDRCFWPFAHMLVRADQEIRPSEEEYQCFAPDSLI